MPGNSARITTYGSIFTGLTLVIGLAALNTGQNLLYLILSVMLAMMLLSMVLSRNNLRSLSVVRHYPMEVYAGEVAHGTVEIINRKHFSNSYSIGIQDVVIAADHANRPEGMEFKTYTLLAPSREPVHAPIRIIVPRRGLYTIHHMRFSSRFPFGFFERVMRLESDGKILAYPHLLPLRNLLPLMPRMAGQRETSQRGHAGGFYGIRAYTPGDPARSVHWKQSAKGQGLKVKEYEAEHTDRFRLMLDLRCPLKRPPQLLRDFEKAVSLTATLSRELLNGGAMVGLWTTIGNVPVSIGPGQTQRIMRALAQVEPQDPATRPVLPERDPGVVELWVEFMQPGSSGARPELVVRRSQGYQQIDATKLKDDLLG